MSFVDPRTYGALVRDAIIPGAVRSRFPGLSLRRAKSMPNARATANMERTSSSSSLESEDTVSIDGGAAASPTRLRAETAGSFPVESALVRYELSTAPTRSSAVDQAAADLAYALMRSARQRSANLPRDDQIVRAMQVDVVKYSLLALPHNLSNAEIATLRESMPEPLQASITNNVSDEEQTIPPSTLRRTMNVSTRIFLSCVMILMPVLMVLASKLLQFERRMELRERMWAFCILMVAYSGIQNVDPEETLRRLRHSPQLRQLRSLLYWIFDGVVGGVLDGWDDTAQKRSAAQMGRQRQGHR